MSEYNIYLDTVNGGLVVPAGTSAMTRLRPFGEDDNPTINIFPVKPVNSLATPYTADDWSTHQISVALCGGTGKPTGTKGVGGSSPVEIARQDVFTWAGDHVTGTLDCTKDEFAAFLSVLDEKKTVLEIRDISPNGQTTRYHLDASTFACVMEGASTGPLSRSRRIPPIAINVPAGQNSSGPIVVPYLHGADLPLFTTNQWESWSIQVNEDDPTLNTLTVNLVGVAPAGGLSFYALIFFNP